MSIQNAIGRVLPELRAQAESMFIDAGKALRPTGETAYNSTTQTEEDVFTDLFGPVSCKIKPPRFATRETEVGGRTSVVVPGEVHLPADPDHPEYAELTIGDVWEMTDVGDLSLSRVGRRYRITGEADGSLLTACRYTIERTVS